jgi:hypothetical protein
VFNAFFIGPGVNVGMGECHYKNGTKKQQNEQFE